MAEKYNYELRKDGILWLQESVITGFSYRYLWHTEMELMVILSGSLVYFAGGRDYHLKQGDMLFFNEGCGHSIISNGAENVSLSLKLHPRALREWGAGNSLAKQCVCLTLESAYSELALRRIRQGIAAVHSYLSEESSIGNRAAGTAAALVFMEILRTAGLLEENGEPGEGKQDQRERLAKAFSYIEDHFMEHVSLREAAEQAGYNRTYFSGLFRRQTGLSLTEYVNRRRIQAAISYLEDGEDTLTDVAMKSGFPDYDAFSSGMMRYCGRKPQEYRSCIQLGKKKTTEYRHYVDCPDEAVERQFSIFELGHEPDERLLQIGQYAAAILDLTKNG